MKVMYTFIFLKNYLFKIESPNIFLVEFIWERSNSHPYRGIGQLREGIYHWPKCPVDYTNYIFATSIICKKKN